MTDPGSNAQYEDIRILILEDNPVDAELLEYELRGAGLVFTARHVGDKISYLNALREFCPDVILSDYDLPAFSGAKALKIRKEICPETPFILVTGAIGEERAIEVLTGGATDYVLKNNLSRLLPAVRRALHENYELRRRKKAEAERDALLKDLEKRVQERTEALEAANSDLESFTYSVSHDLRAPLRAIEGFAAILAKSARGKLDEDEIRRFNLIRDNTKQMNHLIDDLLALSRIGRVEISRKKIDMEKLAEAVWQQHLDANPGRVISFRRSDLPRAVGDESLIWQVFSNLLSNSVKYTRKRKKAVIEIGGETKNGEGIFFVKDNGTGFDMKYYDRLFGVFQRLHSESEYEGTGVGLAIVQRIVNRHGGRVWAIGKVGKGATFYFSLPRSSPSPS